jgi:hypothetical protein
MRFDEREETMIKKCPIIQRNTFAHIGNKYHVNRRHAFSRLSPAMAGVQHNCPLPSTPT